jgi:hypothetical protein
VFKAMQVFLRECLDVLVSGLSDDQENDFHLITN